VVRRERLTIFQPENLEECYHLTDESGEERIILKCILKTVCTVVDWINLALNDIQDLVNTAQNRVRKEYFSTG
jgi:hypothetical protein